jgi:hypothetical protein
VNDSTPLFNGFFSLRSKISPTSYFLWCLALLVIALIFHETVFYGVLILIFVLQTLKRLNDIDRPRWYLWFIFAPGINIALFLLLILTRRSGHSDLEKSDWKFKVGAGLVGIAGLMLPWAIGAYGASKPMPTLIGIFVFTSLFTCIPIGIAGAACLSISTDERSDRSIIVIPLVMFVVSSFILYVLGTRYKF